MDKETLVRIMTEPKNSIVKQYKALFKMDNIDLEFEKEALERIAELTIVAQNGSKRSALYNRKRSAAAYV